MCEKPKKGSFIAALCYSLTPAVVAGLATAIIHPALGVLVGAGVFGFGMHVTYWGNK